MVIKLENDFISSIFKLSLVDSSVVNLVTSIYLYSIPMHTLVIPSFPTL